MMEAVHTSETSVIALITPSGSELGTMVGSWQCGIEPSGSIRGREFLTSWLTISFSKEGSVPRYYLANKKNERFWAEWQCKWSKTVCFSYTVDQVATSDELEDLLEKNGAAVFVDNVSLQKNKHKNINFTGP
jgi:hypothetical protein